MTKQIKFSFLSTHFLDAYIFFFSVLFKLSLGLIMDIKQAFFILFQIYLTTPKKKKKKKKIFHFFKIFIFLFVFLSFPC